MNIVLSFFPVLLFLTFLYLFDSFKLVRIKILTMCLMWGGLSVLICYFLNTFILNWVSFEMLTRYIAPEIEETCKAIFIIYLVSKKKIGFMIDAAIYGFAIGAGFSFMENIYYLINTTSEYDLMTWIIRGFGTALMHGGCTSLIFVFFIGGINRINKMFLVIIPGLLLAFFIHSGFNHFFLNPLLQTMLIFISLPIAYVFVFGFGNTKLQQWLEIEFNSEVEILSMILQGAFNSTKAGLYLLSIKDRFAPETIVDMYCYVSLYLELSIKAKRNLMLKENGFPIILEEDIQQKLKELSVLRKRIGKIAELALAPLIRMDHRNLWKLNQLKV